MNMLFLLVHMAHEIYMPRKRMGVQPNSCEKTLWVLEKRECSFETHLVLFHKISGPLKSGPQGIKLS